MKKLIAFIVFIIFTLTTTVSLANEDAEVAIITRPGAVSPFAGVLYSNKAYAEMKAKEEAQLQNMKNEHDFKLKMLENDLKLQNNILEIDLESTKKQLNYAIDANKAQNEQHIKEMSDMTTRNTIEKGVYFGLGVVTVILGAIGISLVNNAINN